VFVKKNKKKKSLSEFVEIVENGPFRYCKDEKYQYIIKRETDEVIYKKEYTQYSQSCFCYCGNTEKGPVFYDARYSTYLYPENNGYKVYNELFNYPIVVNGQNVMNITEGDGGVGVIDALGNEILKNQYDSLTVELKITARQGDKTSEKTIPFSKNNFEKGIVCEIQDMI